MQADVFEERASHGMPVALTIAGSDSSGGAGIQADIKTMLACGVFAMSAITSLTAQNTTGVFAVHNVPGDFVRAQIDAAVTDIPPQAVKIGMVSNAEIARAIAQSLREHKLENVVLDPVMVATSGARLLDEDAVGVLTQELIPLARVITPNIPEAQVLSGMSITSREDMRAAAQRISQQYGCAVLCKGGHSLEDANDVLVEGEQVTWFEGKRISNLNTHGTGCTLSSAIASYLARGASLTQAIERAKAYLSRALASQLDLGHGSGPLDHGVNLSEVAD